MSSPGVNSRGPSSSLLARDSRSAIASLRKLPIDTSEVKPMER